MARKNNNQQLVGRSDMSAKPEPEKYSPPTPMTDKLNMTGLDHVEKVYPGTKAMKYGGTVTYNNGPRKIRR